MNSFRCVGAPRCLVYHPTPTDREDIEYIRYSKIDIFPKNIAATCGQLVKLHKGEVPDKRKDLEALPGVGRKTANVILNTAFGVPVIAVDTHIFRLSNRTGLAPGETVIKVEQKLMSVVPAKWKKDAHHLLILHGRYVCRARKPDCEHCVISQECEHPDKIVT